MNTTTQQILFWIPRVLCILFALFLSMFALDVFSEGNGFGETILALLIHLVPTYLMVIVLVIAWRWEGIGAIFFIFFALFFLVASRGESWIISGPLFLIGVLFLFNWVYREQLKTQ
jgi:hypothetical protein